MQNTSAAMTLIAANRLLEELPSTPDDVAQHLQSLGIKGVRNAVRFLNPIVRYAQTHIDALDMDVMTGSSLRIRLRNGTQQEVSLPTAIQAFLTAFNQGAYPDLETQG
jgi:hypothetical protein